MRDSTRAVDKFQGYFLEDTECQWCLHYQGEKKGCTLDQCCCEAEKLDATANGRINRKRGSTKWDG